MSWFGKKKKAEPSVSTEALQKIAVMKRLVIAGLLYIDIPNKQVIISATLASLFLNGRERWSNFLQNVQLWFVYKASQLMWNKLFLDVEVEAVRKAREEHPNLNLLQEKTIRQQARATVDIEACEPPKLEAYDFIITSDWQEGKEPSVIAVGRWDKGSFEMAPYDEVKEKIIP